MKKSELRNIIREEIKNILKEAIKVKNVGEAKRVLSKNGIKVTSSRYTSGNEGEISTDNDYNATSLLRSFGLWKG